MSLRPGSCFQPVSLTSGGALSVAPQRGQLNWAASITAAHHGQVVCRPDGVGGAITASARAGAGGAGGGGATGGDGTGMAAGASGCFTCAPHETQKFASSFNCDPQFVQNMAYSVW
jgi:hypothetical protein